MVFLQRYPKFGSLHQMIPLSCCCCCCLCCWHRSELDNDNNSTSINQVPEHRGQECVTLHDHGCASLSYSGVDGQWSHIPSWFPHRLKQKQSCTQYSTGKQVKHLKQLIRYDTAAPPPPLGTRGLFKTTNMDSSVMVWCLWGCASFW